jgi:type I restriction enzyme S subunit
MDLNTKDTKDAKEKDLRPLPDGWLWTTLGETLKWGSGGTPLRSNPAYYDNGDIPWVIIGDLNDGVVTDTQSKITQLGLKNSSAKWVEEGSVLIAMYGSIGKLGIAGRRLTTNQAIAFTKPDLVNAKYLFYYLMGERKNLLNLGAGATQQNISQTVIKVYPFPLAPLAEQERIVARLEELLSDLEAGVAALGRVRAGVKRYKASMLKAACEGKLFGEKGIVNGELPEGWRWATVGEVSQKIQYGTSEKASLDVSGIPVLRMGNVQDGELDYTNLKYLPEDIVPDNLILEPGDLIFNRTNSAELVGKTAIYKRNYPKATFASYLIRAQLIPDCSPDYVSYYINSVHGRNYIYTVVSQQVGQANVNGTKLANMPIPLPPADEQRRIVAEVERRLESARAVESAVEAGLKRAGRLRQAVLQSAFEGRM